ncbi:MAG: hypothetical protein DRI61_02115 [Chloroflexi bacterium]|nr:MAG: hypothetical protein DRI61_02115 [Chloroflexota bacterium]HDN80418.1 hypothetical protein [Chloroflexota bacterium]
MEVREYLSKLERNLILGSGRWVANFNESFRDFLLGGYSFAMMVRGSTRSGGFFLSRLFATLALPDYNVACFVYAGEVKKSTLQTIVGLLRKYMQENDIRWSWLVVPREGPFSEGLKDAVSRMDFREIGVALLDLTSGEIHTNPHMGRKMIRYVRF